MLDTEFQLLNSLDISIVLFFILWSWTDQDCRQASSGAHHIQNSCDRSCLPQQHLTPFRDFRSYIILHTALISLPLFIMHVDHWRTLWGDKNLGVMTRSTKWCVPGWKHNQKYLFPLWCVKHISAMVWDVYLKMWLYRKITYYITELYILKYSVTFLSSFVSCIKNTGFFKAWSGPGDHGTGQAHWLINKTIYGCPLLILRTTDH